MHHGINEGRSRGYCQNGGGCTGNKLQELVSPVCPAPYSVESVPSVPEGDKISREALRIAQAEDEAISFVIKLVKMGEPIQCKREETVSTAS